MLQHPDSHNSYAGIQPTCSLQFTVHCGTAGLTAMLISIHFEKTFRKRPPQINQDYDCKSINLNEMKSINQINLNEMK